MAEAMDYGSTASGGMGGPSGGGFGPGRGFGSGGGFDSGDPFEAGIEAASRRLSYYGLEAMAGEVATDVANQAQEALSAWPSELPPRAVELFVELVVVGAAARLNYGEDRLSQDDIHEFLGHLVRFENSWFHSPP